MTNTTITNEQKLSTSTWKAVLLVMAIIAVYTAVAGVGYLGISNDFSDSTIVLSLMVSAATVVAITAWLIKAINYVKTDDANFEKPITGIIIATIVSGIIDILFALGIGAVGTIILSLAITIIAVCSVLYTINWLSVQAKVIHEAKQQALTLNGTIAKYHEFETQAKTDLAVVPQLKAEVIHMQEANVKLSNELAEYRVKLTDKEDICKRQSSQIAELTFAKNKVDEELTTANDTVERVNKEIIELHKVADDKSKVVEQLQKDISTKTRQLIDTRKTLEHTENHCAELSKNVDELKEQLSSLNDTHNGTVATTVNLSNSLSESRKALATAENNCSQLTNKVHDLQEQLSALNETNANLVAKNTELAKELTIARSSDVPDDYKMLKEFYDKQMAQRKKYAANAKAKRNKQV